MNIYGLLIGIGVVIGIELIHRFQKELKYSEILIILLSTLIGARILFLFHNIEEIKSGIINPFAIWNGGLAFYGGLICLMISTFILSKIKDKKFLKLSDSILLFVPLIHVIGRIGNFFNYELYGKPSSLPWAISIPLEYRDPRYIQYANFHPVFAYEMILNLLNFSLLGYLYKRKVEKGVITSIYLINYSIIRLLMNRIRIDKEFFLGIESSDLFSVFFLLLGILLLSVAMKKKNELAKIISNLLLPILVFSSLLVSTFTLSVTLSTTLLLIFLTFLIPITTGILFKIFKITSDYDVSKREERPKIFSVFLLCFLISLYISTNTTEILLVDMYSILNLTFFLGILVTLFWKISFHMIISTLSIFFIIYLLQNPYSYLLALLIPLVGWSRVQLKKHDTKQVIGGFLLTLLCILIVLTFMKFW